MTISEYKDKLTDLEKNHNKLRLIEMKKFVDANNKFIIGDIVKDHIGSILIEKISYSWGHSSEDPCAVFFGLELKKNLEPRKDKNKRNVWQGNVL